MLRSLGEMATVTVVPAAYAAADTLAIEPDGVFLSNGPGDPAALEAQAAIIAELLGRVPVFGICLGHQLLAAALGARTFKLPFGHHGGQPPRAPSRHRPGRDHEPEPQLRRRRRLAADVGAARRRGHPRQPERRRGRRVPVHERARLQRAVPPRGRARAPRRPLSLRARSGTMIDEAQALMPRRTDIETILVIGSGPIVIGQACEFDYSGTQACRVLRAEGYRVVLANSNPATIMTDPEIADRTYVEPLDLDVADAPSSSASGPTPCCPPSGGQTGLNLAIGLSERGVLDDFGVELIGANAEAISTAEDRDRFKSGHGGDRPRGAGVGLRLAPRRGHGGGRAHRLPAHGPPELHPGRGRHRDGPGPRPSWPGWRPRAWRPARCTRSSIERSIAGWKEYELEVMRDRADNCVVVCSIENFDPMGVHTGDSITVAPAQTLSDVEYQAMRDDAFACIRRVGVETGGSNIQFAVEPTDGRRLVIEMNPRVSRSSALASKATGFPIAKIAARLAVGYTLDEIPNDITGATPASFEPTIDYVVTKIPRWAFEKLPGAVDRLGTRMQSVGEVMAIGRTFPESLQKAIRSLEQGRAGLNGDPAEVAYDLLDDDELVAQRLLAHARARLPARGGAAPGRHPRRPGRRPPGSTRGSWTSWPSSARRAPALETMGVVGPRARPSSTGGRGGPSSASASPTPRSPTCCRRGWPGGGPGAAPVTEADVRAARLAAGVRATFKTVDTCGAEFEAQHAVPLRHLRGRGRGPARRRRPRVVILGSGPNRIGQGIEFDYCCVHASMALRDAGYETVMVNCNPETVSTDYDTSDRLYFEPLTAEDVANVLDAEIAAGAGPGGAPVAGVIVSLGGQTPLKLAHSLAARAGPRHEPGVDRPGRGPRALERPVRAPRHPPTPGGTAVTVDEALAVAHKVGYPVLVRPSYVLGGRAMEIVYDDERLTEVVERAGGVAGPRGRRVAPSARCSSTGSSRTPSRSTWTPCATRPARC